MTAIIAVIRDGHAYMAGDLQTQDGTRKYHDPAGKVWRDGDMLIGVSGRTDTMHAIRHAFSFPHRALATSDEEYMRVIVPDALREFLKGRGKLKEENGEWCAQMEMLIVWHGDVWEIDRDLCALNCQGAGAVGDGGLMALGALLGILDNPNPRPIGQALDSAIAIAASRCLNVGFPWTSISMPVRSETETQPSNTASVQPVGT